MAPQQTSDVKVTSLCVKDTSTISIISIMISSNMIITTSIGTSEEDVERLVAAMDVDGDGKVTYQEYLNSFRLDADYALCIVLQLIQQVLILLMMVKLMLTMV